MELLPNAGLVKLLYMESSQSYFQNSSFDVGSGTLQAKRCRFGQLFWNKKVELVLFVMVQHRLLQQKMGLCEREGEQWGW